MNLDRLLDPIAFIDLLECILLHVLLVMCWPFRLFDLDDSNRWYTDDAVQLIQKHGIALYVSLLSMRRELELVSGTLFVSLLV